MSYITTFDAAFWTSIALFVVMQLAMPKLIGPATAFAIKHFKTYIALIATITISTIVLWFWWSVEGTTTSMFWGTIACVIFFKPLMKQQMKMQEAAFDYLAKTHA